jgi:hypothetical protein
VFGAGNLLVTFIGGGSIRLRHSDDGLLRCSAAGRESADRALDRRMDVNEDAPVARRVASVGA